ncbi:MAG TPA: hypothetical protein VF498_07455 [Anaerolineales bacterium]
MTYPNLQSPFPKRHVTRPFRVTLLALGVLSIAALHLLRLGQAVQEWIFLSGLLPISPLYLALSGLAWGLVGLALASGLWLGKHWAPRLTRLAVPAYGLYYWLDRLLLVNPVVWRTNLPFTAAATLALLVVIFWILSGRKVKAFFGEIYGY